MKLRKIMAIAAASAIAATATVSAGAVLAVPGSGVDAGCDIGSGSWLVQVYNTGNSDEGKPATDYGVDLSKVAQITFTVTINNQADADFFEGAIGGSVVFSVNGGDIAQGTELWDKYNWPSCEWWGVIDPDLELETFAADKPGKVETVEKGVYKITNDTLVNPFVEDGVKEIGCMQIGLQEWGSDLCPIEVTMCEIKDADGNVLIAFDGLGKKVDAPDADAPATDAPATDAPSDAPATDDPTTDTPVSPETGAEGIAVAAGVAVLATTAAIVAKKRK